MTFLFSVEWGTHANVHVKAGADRDHLIHSGSLVLSEAEWNQLKHTLTIGAKKSQAKVLFEVKE